jgi:ABC-2 type transport system permease protein
MVLIFATRFTSRSHAGSWVFPAAIAYCLVGVTPMFFNVFGTDGLGTQVYFLTPVRMRDVLLAKNIFNTGVAAVEILAVLLLVTFLTGPPTPIVLGSSLLWVIATLLLQLAIGNRMSITSPKRIDPARTAQKQAKPLTALLSMGILLACAALGFALLTLVDRLPDIAWVLPLSMLVFVAVAAVIYWQNIEAMDVFAVEHREALLEELSRKA